jgi:3-oxoacyl-[acyl-carrier-protein] synthase II
MSKRRVVVTSMGAVTPLGDTPEDLWSSIAAGKSGIGFLTRIPEAEQTCIIGGEHPDFKPEDYMDKKESRRMDRFAQFGFAAARSAYDTSGLEGHIDKTRLAVIIGSGAGGLTTIHEQLVQCQTKGFHKCSPFLVPMMITDMGSGSCLYCTRG